MTHQEILTTAIEKAIAGGYKPDGIQDVTSCKPTIRSGQAWVRWFNNDGQEVIQDMEHVIYDKNFARALWGEEVTTDGMVAKGMDEDYGPAWQYHLQQMVIDPRPIEYLGAHLDE